MKSITYSLLFILLVLHFSKLSAQTTDFVTTWKTDNGYIASNKNKITIQIGYSYTAPFDYTVNWGDGTITNVQNFGSTHTYATPGTYTVRISGSFPSIELYNPNGDNALKILSVDQWGSAMNWSYSLANAFWGCSNLVINATDAPNLSGVTDLSFMFSGCSKLTTLNSNNWNTSNITSMAGMFSNATLFNQNIGNWNTGNVTNMSQMFSGATTFNQNIGNWNTSKVNYMENMFRNAFSFNQNIGNWNTANVIYMNGLFNNAGTFNQNIGNWNTGSVTDMNNMFRTAYAFNQNIESWNTGSVKDMSYMFSDASAFNQNISNWNTGNVTNMSGMFNRATTFNRNIGNWNINKVANMTAMLDYSGLNTANYDSALIGWNNQPHLKNITLGAIGRTYCAAAAARASLILNDGWIISNDYVAPGCPPPPNTTADFITTWKTNNPGTSSSTQITIPTTGTGYNYNVNWGDGTFSTNVTGTITHTYVSAGTYTVGISGAFPRIYFNNSGDIQKILSVEQWGTAINWTSFYNAFYGCANLVVNATDAPKLSGVTDVSFMFANCAKLTQLHSTNWNTVSITNMSYMFDHATLFNQDISNWNISNVTNMSFMFQYATAFNQNIGHWNISKVLYMNALFDNAGLTRANYDSILIGWNAQPHLKNILLGANGLRFCEGATARGSLITTDGWTISGDLLLCPNQPTDFVTTWKTNNFGTSASNQITIPTTGTGYNYNVNWGDSTTSIGVTGSITHTYANSGTYTVGISGAFPQIYFGNNGDGQKLLSIDQWGTAMNWKSFKWAFAGCQNLVINATDVPDLSSVTDLTLMFLNCYKLTTLNSNNWNTSNITNMSSMFLFASSFNQNIGNWNTANVTNMSGMFRGATIFNQNIGNWNTANVTIMDSMFYAARSFNQNIGNWNTANVTSMKAMFFFGDAFNQNIGNWNTAKVTDLSYMFWGAYSFNQDIGNWNTANVTKLTQMFYSARAFNQNIGNWNTANVTDMSFMFSYATAFDQNIGHWNINNISPNIISNSGPVYQITGLWQMLDSTHLSLKNYDSTLIGWSNQPHPQYLKLGAKGLKFCSALTAHTMFTGIDNWTITGDNIGCAYNYLFTGAGNWSNPANWTNGIAPLDSIPLGSTILINPNAGGSCVVDIPVHIPPGISVTVAANKRLIIQGNLIIQ